VFVTVQELLLPPQCLLHLLPRPSPHRCPNFPGCHGAAVVGPAEKVVEQRILEAISRRRKDEKTLRKRPRGSTERKPCCCVVGKALGSPTTTKEGRQKLGQIILSQTPHCCSCSRASWWVPPKTALISSFAASPSPSFRPLLVRLRSSLPSPLHPPVQRTHPCSGVPSWPWLHLLLVLVACERHHSGWSSCSPSLSTGAPSCRPVCPSLEASSVRQVGRNWRRSIWCLPRWDLGPQAHAWF